MPLVTLMMPVIALAVAGRHVMTGMAMDAGMDDPMGHATVMMAAAIRGLTVVVIDWAMIPVVSAEDALRVDRASTAGVATHVGGGGSDMKTDPGLSLVRKGDHARKCRQCGKDNFSHNLNFFGCGFRGVERGGSGSYSTHR